MIAKHHKLFGTFLIVLIVVLMMVLGGCASKTDGIQSGASSGPAALSSAKESKLVILHTNDAHGNYQCTEDSVGMPSVMQIKQDYIDRGYDVLLFDVGDTLQGTVLVDGNQGEVVPGLMNIAKYDAVALGSHDFDYGIDVLKQRMEAYDFPVLSANITVDETGAVFSGQANTVFTLSNRMKVGVFGLTAPETKTISAPKNTEGLSFASSQDLYDCAQAQIDDLESKGCDVIVCLGHLGEEELVVGNRAQDVIENTSGIDLFIDAHDHEIENTFIQDKLGNNVKVVETGSDLEAIGVVKMENGVFVETLSAPDFLGEEATKLETQINLFVSEQDKIMSEIVGSTPFKLYGERAPGVRTTETNLGDFVADAVLWEAEKLQERDIDAAIINAGAIQTSLIEGEIALKDLHAVYPISNQIYTIQVTGDKLVEALEAACQTAPDQSPNMPQVSGISFEINTDVDYEAGDTYPGTDCASPAKPGSRVTIFDVGGKAFDPDATYTIATTDALVSGRDAYYAFFEASQNMESTGALVFQAMRYYLAEECGGVVSDRYSDPQGRIRIQRTLYSLMDF